MNKARTELIWGLGLLVVGFPLWYFTGDVQTPVFTLSKVGMVLMVVGLICLIYSLVLALMADERRERNEP